MNSEFTDLKDAVLVALGAFALIALAVGIFVSLRRNSRDIEAFEHSDLRELKLCIPAYQIMWLDKKMAGMGWHLISKEPDQRFRSNLHVRFQMKDDEARPLKDVLHSLNRSLALSIGPLNLHREEPKE